MDSCIQSGVNILSKFFSPIFHISIGLDAHLLKIQATLVIRGGCFHANRRMYRKRVKRETYNMPVNFLSDTP
jgi:hypothetical protein